MWQKTQFFTVKIELNKSHFAMLLSLDPHNSHPIRKTHVEI